MCQGRKPSRTIKLNIRDGEKLPCPLGVLRGTKDIEACTQIKAISNKSLLITNINLFSLTRTFALLFLFPETEHMFPVRSSRLPAPRSKEPAQNKSSCC